MRVQGIVSRLLEGHTGLLAMVPALITIVLKIVLLWGKKAMLFMHVACKVLAVASAAVGNDYLRELGGLQVSRKK